MSRLLLIAGTALVAVIGPATAQSDTLPSNGSTAGVTILGTGRSLSPANLTPTGLRTPQGFPPAWAREEAVPTLSKSKTRQRR